MTACPSISFESFSDDSNIETVLYNNSLYGNSIRIVSNGGKLYLTLNEYIIWNGKNSRKDYAAALTIAVRIKVGLSLK